MIPAGPADEVVVPDGRRRFGLRVDRGEAVVEGDIAEQGDADGAGEVDEAGIADIRGDGVAAGEGEDDAQNPGAEEGTEEERIDHHHVDRLHGGTADGRGPS